MELVMKQRYVNQSKFMLKIPIQIDQFSSREIETQLIRLHPPQLPPYLQWKMVDLDRFLSNHEAYL